MTQMAAEDYCVAQGGHLASVHSVSDAKTIAGLGMTGSYWIGMHDRDQLTAVEAGCSGETFAWTGGPPASHCPPPSKNTRTTSSPISSACIFANAVH
jgi:hypothetical protein